MAINERLIDTEVAAADGDGAASAEQGLILHLDANDVDSFDGNGDANIWYDISEHDVTVPLTDNDDNLKIHINASDSSSYGGSGSTVTDLKGNGDFTLTGNASFDKDNGGYFAFDGTGDGVKKSTATTGFDGDFTLEFWYNLNELNNFTLFFGRKLASDSTITGLYLGNAAGSARQMEVYRKPADGGALSSTTVTWTSDLTTNKWHHMVVVFEGQKIKCYLDGELNVTSSNFMTDSAGYNDSYGSIELGSYVSSAYELSGELGAFRFYEEALSASEIGQNYRHGRDYIYTDLAGTPFLHYDPANTDSYSGTGTTLTDLAGNNNADLLGGIESGWDKELGNSFPITGSGDGITTSSTVSVNPATDGMTIEMWFKIDSDSQNYLFSFDGSGTTYNALSYRSNTDKVAWFYRTGISSTSQIDSPTVTLNKWHHLVATTDGSGAQIYLDGEVGDTTTNNAYSVTYNEDLHFGNLYDLAQNSNTDIGQIRFYKGHLTADEVMQNYLFTKNDYPNGYNGTISGATYSSPNASFDFSGGDQIKGAATTKFTMTPESSLLVWFKTHSVSVDDGTYIVSNSDYVSGHVRNWTFYHRLSSLYFDLQGSTDNIITISTSLAANTWYFAVVTYDGTDHKAYLSTTSQPTGTAVSDAYTGTPDTNSYPFIIGTDGNGTSAFDGEVGIVKFYDKALTLSEVQAAYNDTKSTYV